MASLCLPLGTILAENGADGSMSLSGTGSSRDIRFLTGPSTLGCFEIFCDRIGLSRQIWLKSRCYSMPWNPMRPYLQRGGHGYKFGPRGHIGGFALSARVDQSHEISVKSNLACASVLPRQQTWRSHSPWASSEQLASRFTNEPKDIQTGPADT